MSLARTWQGSGRSPLLLPRRGAGTGSRARREDSGLRKETGPKSRKRANPSSLGGTPGPMLCEQLAVLRLTESGPVSQRLESRHLTPQAVTYPGKEVLAVSFQGHQESETVECLWKCWSRARWSCAELGWGVRRMPPRRTWRAAAPLGKGHEGRFGRLPSGKPGTPSPLLLLGPASAQFSECPLSSRTRATSREEKNLQGFLEQPKEKWVESAFEVDGPHYFTVLALHVLPPEKWRAVRVEILRRLLVTSQARAVSPGGATRSVLASGSLCSGGCCLGSESHSGEAG